MSDPPFHAVGASVKRTRTELALAAGHLTVRSEPRGAGCVVAVSSELDLATVPAVMDELMAVVATGAHPAVLDLTGLEFIDITGVHPVARADARSRADGAWLMLRRGPGQVQQVSELTATSDLLPFVA